MRNKHNFIKFMKLEKRALWFQAVVWFFIPSTLNINYNTHNHILIQITILKERNNTFKYSYSFVQNIFVLACCWKCISITCHSVILQLLCIRVQCNMRMISSFKSCTYWCLFSHCSKSQEKLKSTDIAHGTAVAQTTWICTYLTLKTSGITRPVSPAGPI